MRRILCCFLLFAAALTAESVPIRLTRPAEVVAELQMRSPGSDWAQRGREAAVAVLRLGERPPHYVTLFGGNHPRTYSVFLGSLEAGEHTLRVERDAKWSAPASGFELLSVKLREYRAGDPDYQLIANAPILYARQDTLGRFSDVPLVSYCERLEENGRPLLQYTMIFSNEDGGTSTRALMARWGRTTDIEYIYRVYLSATGEPQRATIQTRNHREVDFDGAREGRHPILYVITHNNMVAAEGPATLRYQLAPRWVDLRHASRERVMDDDPLLYRVMTQELEREGKLRPFGAVQGENISDPRNYLYLEMELSNSHSALAALVRLRGEDRWRSSHLGRSDYAVSRDGWIRTTVELPPGTQPAAIAELGFQCLVIPTRIEGKDVWPQAGRCRLNSVRRVFLLDRDYRPGPEIWSPPPSALPAEIPGGEIRTFSP